MHPRYFIGITLPDSLSDEITKTQKALFAGQNVMDPLRPHITLMHPNILMTISPIYLLPKIKVLAESELPIDIELARTDMFDDRVIHIAVKSPGLVKFQQKLIDLLPDDIRARYEVGRIFSPHVTLAQAKPLQALDPVLIEGIEKRISKLLPKKFEAKELAVFTWQGPRKYKVESI